MGESARKKEGSHLGLRVSGLWVCHLLAVRFFDEATAGTFLSWNMSLGNPLNIEAESDGSWVTLIV